MDSAGDIAFDSEGMPKNANFFLDIDTGNAYFRGRLRATSGLIGGYTIEDSYLHAGSGSSYVGLNGGTSVHTDYAMWAGASEPNRAPFYVKKDGALYAKNGIFSGIIQASNYLDQSGKSMINNAGQFTSEYLDVRGLNVNDRFKVDENGDVTITNGSISWGAVTDTSELDARISSAKTTANNAKTVADNAASDAKKIADGMYSGTFIDGKKIISPEIYTNMLEITVPKGTSGVAGLLLSGYIGNKQYDMFQIRNSNESIYFTSPADANAIWNIFTRFYDYVHFESDVYFHGKVHGITAVWA